MSGLMRYAVAAGLRSLSASRGTFTPALASHLNEQSPSSLSSDHSRSISHSSALCKRKGGASAFAVKTSSWNRSKGNKSHSALSTKQKLKKNAAPHRSHLERTRDLKRKEQENVRNAKEWAKLEKDEELNRELDQVFEYLNNSGPMGDYVYQPEPTLEDVDEKDALAKLNAIARADPDVMKEVDEAVAKHTEETEEPQERAVQHTLTVDDYNFLLTVYATKSMHKEANALLTRMEKNLDQIQEDQAVVSVKPTDSTELALIEALDSVPHVVAPDVKSYMLYATALGMTGKAAPAVRVLGRMKERGVVPNVAMYNAVMRACTKGGRVTWAYNVMEKMQVAGLVPDRASFTILMNAAIAENDIDKAFETFNLMRTHVADPDEVAFNCIINGFARVGRIERALNLLEDMLECRLTPSLVTYNTLMNACAKSHYYAHKAVDFYYEMQELLSRSFATWIAIKSL
ncbi:hypothetical protein PHYBOEH_003890 [Phytophthora boehmeriae]|uniref:Pentacotripeptide-repeat region of PRORP domain-containing protein n=1 Tax=Phytophthora boehmeriae TaxID=109152 RepID=A0A8T1WUP7_9STRA|nr:hypothetical protein PHYBOEH_003890 [Phytophthora boehmeriae]